MFVFLCVHVSFLSVCVSPVSMFCVHLHGCQFVLYSCVVFSPLYLTICVSFLSVCVCPVFMFVCPVLMVVTVMSKCFCAHGTYKSSFSLSPNVLVCLSFVCSSFVSQYKLQI